MRKIPLYAYVASNNPVGAVEVIKSFGLAAPQSEEDVFRGLRHVQSTFGREGIVEIAKAHPDRELLMSVNSTKEDVKSNANGSSCGCHSNANGTSGNESANQAEINRLKEEKLLEKIEASKSSLTREDIADEFKKAMDKTNPFIKNNLPYIALGGVALFFIWGTLKN